MKNKTKVIFLAALAIPFGILGMAVFFIKESFLIGYKHYA